MSRLILLVGVAVLLAGCGGGGSAPSPSEQVTTTLKNYLHLQAQGEPAQACALLTADGQRRLTAFIADKAKSTPLAVKSMSCEQAIGLVRLVAGTDLLAAMDAAKVENVRVSGDEATADIVGTGDIGRRVVKLSRVGEAWKIRAVPGLGG
jgi:hypothetical protein